jgi:hypothetical protein
MTLSVGFNLTVTRFSFNQIIYNSAGWDPLVSPYLNAYEWIISNSSSSNSIFQIDSVLFNNQFIIGLKTFYTTQGQSTLDFNAVEGTYSGFYGVQVQPSTPSNTSLIGLESSVVSVFYMMTFTCPTGFPYLNITDKQCQDICGGFGYTNTTDNTCRECTDPLCYVCNSSDPATCLGCETNK